MISRKTSDVKYRIMQILKKRQSPVLEYLESVDDVMKLSLSIREKIVDELSDEFCRNGLKPDDEPNEYGLQIEDLIDACALYKG